ncbi:MAG: glycosyltransferase family 4 protein [Kiritimatiellia bacterium]
MPAKKSRPSIAILHYSCPPVIGGVEFVISAHAGLFAEAGFRTKLIVGKGGSVHPDVKTAVVPEISSDGGPVRRVVRSLLEGKVPEGFDAAVKRVESALSRNLRGVDICFMHNVMTMHFNLVLTAALANLIKRRRSPVFVAWTHDSTFGDSSYSRHQRYDYPWSVLSTPVPGCRYCAISEHCRKEITSLFGISSSGVTVVPDGIDVPRLLGLTEPVRELFFREKLYETDVTALTPTRIVRRKNLEAGIDITAAIKKQGRRVRWIITGAPDPHNRDANEYFDRLLARRRQKRVQKEVIFLCERFAGRVSDEDLRGLFSLSDMLIFPSLREGFGIPVLEGGLAGQVLVLNDVPALREIAGRRAVYIREGVSAAETARKAIRAFDRSPRLRFRREIISGYSWHSVFRKRILPLAASVSR